MSVTQKFLPTELEQNHWIAFKIRSLLNQGVLPQEIAILSRKHPTLQKISTTLLANNVPFAYEKKENILTQKHIEELVILLKFVDLILLNPMEADVYLPKILGFEWLEVSSDELWKISLEARNNWIETIINGKVISRPKLWSEVIMKSPPTGGVNMVDGGGNSPFDEKWRLGSPKSKPSTRQKMGGDEVDGVFQEQTSTQKVPLSRGQNSQDFGGSSHSLSILNWLISIAQKSLNSTFETIIDELIGVDNFSNSLHKNIDIDDDLETTENQKNESKVETFQPIFQSKYKQFYFDNNKNQVEYIKLLSNLRKLIQTIRDYNNGDYSVSSSVKILDNLVKNKIPIIDNSPFNNPTNCVNLMTVHSSKGLEFEYVFIVNCQKSEWQKAKSGSNMIVLPMNLRTASKEDYDDFVRLFFVAVTRAKHNAILTGYELNENSKPELPIDFLGEDSGIAEDEFEPNFEQDNLDIRAEILSNNKVSQSQAMIKMLKIDYRDLLAKELSNYKLSVTHLTNFLDITKGGPKYFLENNLLRFPYSKNPKSKYGTAIHEAITRFYQFWQKENTPGKIAEKPNLNKLLGFYEFALRSQGLDTEYYQDYLNVGQKRLQEYYGNSSFDIKSKVAVNFAHEDVTIGGAKIKGELDKIDIADSKIIVTDYKTGSPIKWKNFAPYKDIKAWSYRTQLEFYKLLIENSRTYGRYCVDQGVLEFVDNYELEPSTLELFIEPENIDKLQKIIPIVYNKIINLDFPDTDHYPENLKGIMEFMEDLLEGKV